MHLLWMGSQSRLHEAHDSQAQVQGQRRSNMGSAAKAVAEVGSPAVKPCCRWLLMLSPFAVVCLILNCGSSLWTALPKDGPV